MSSLLSTLLAIFTAVFAAVAVGLLTLLVMRSFTGGANRAIIAAMPRYTARDYQGYAAATKEGQAAESPSPFLRLANLLTTAKYRGWMQDKLAEIGLRGPIAMRAQLIKKVTYAVVGAIVGLLLATRVAEFWLLLVSGLTIAGFFTPDLVLVSEGQKRADLLERGLPDAIDLLNLCVESGLSFENGIARVSLSLDGPVAEEFGGLIADIQLGKSRSEALSQLAERTKSKGMKRFLSAILQVDRLGVPISGVLAEQASEMRAVRKDRAREQGQKVTVKILMPLMFCFLPAMFLIVLGPAVVQLVKTMSLL